MSNDTKFPDGSTSLEAALAELRTPEETRAAELRAKLADLNEQGRLRATVAEHGAGVLEHLTPEELACYHRSMEWACVGDISQATSRTAAALGYTNSGLPR